MENNWIKTRVQFAWIGIRHGFYFGYGLSRWEGRLRGIALYFGLFEITLDWSTP